MRWAVNPIDSGSTPDDKNYCDFMTKRDINVHSCSNCRMIVAERKEDPKRPGILTVFKYAEYDIIDRQFKCKNCQKKAKALKAMSEVK